MCQWYCDPVQVEWCPTNPHELVNVETGEVYLVHTWQSEYRGKLTLHHNYAEFWLTSL